MMPVLSPGPKPSGRNLLLSIVTRALPAIALALTNRKLPWGGGSCPLAKGDRNGATRKSPNAGSARTLERQLRFIGQVYVLRRDFSGGIARGIEINLENSGHGR